MKNISTLFLHLILLALLVTTAVYAQSLPNDECSGAIVVSAIPYADTENTTLATPNVTDPALPCADGGGGKSVWFQFTPATTAYYTFSSRYSTPATYDVAFGLFTGTCGHLAMLDCNDDIIPGTIRQSEISDTLHAGVTYSLLVAEWKGGGPSGGVPTGGTLVFEVFRDSVKPLYKGPVIGSVSSGAVINTGLFMSIAPGTPMKPHFLDEVPDVRLIKTHKGVVKPTGKAGSNLMSELGIRQSLTASSQPVVLENFKGMDATGYIPPDAICAAGPNYVITMANSMFRIYKKDGTLVKSLDLNSWFSDVKNPSGFSDPQVIYDQYAHHWVMAGIATSTPYTILLSVSDDDDPNGVWYNWSLPATLGDSVTGNLPDYPQMGYDDQAIYVTTRDFGPTSFRYTRIRVIDKSQLYAGSAGSVSWFDLWDFREPDHRTVPLDGIRPSEIFGHPGVHFFVNRAPYDPGTFVTLWTLTNPLTNPVFTGQNIPVVEYYVAPNADQSGGTSTLIDGGGSDIRHRAIYRDSSLWISHSIALDSISLYSAVRYVRLNPFTGTVLEDQAMGSAGYWHFYPSLMVDGNKNLVITYTQSSVSDYPGVYVTGRKNGDPPGLSPSIQVKSGDGHYLAVGNGSNRWGDYSGAALDPADSLSVWINTEYAAGTDAWGEWAAHIKMSPVAGKYLYGNPLSHNFSFQEVGTTSNVFTVTVKNYGADPVQLSNITKSSPHFQFQGLPSFPYPLASGETLAVHVVFAPLDTGTFTNTISVLSDDSLRSPITATVTGIGFHIVAAQQNMMYAGSGTNDAGRLYTMNPTTGAVTAVGYTGYQQVSSIRVRPSNHELIGLLGSGRGYYLARVNTNAGDAHPLSFINISFLKGMEFIDDTSLYVTRIDGSIYKANLNTGATTLVASTGILLSAIAMNPISHQFYVSIRNTDTPDSIYRVSLPSGKLTAVGATGFGTTTEDLQFDLNGNLFGLIGAGADINRLILIDTLTGAGTIVGSTGRASMQAITFGPNTAFTVGTYRIKPGWNMVSLPLTVTNRAVSSILPTVYTEAFNYQGNYYGDTTMQNGLGYWVKSSAATDFMYFGNSPASDTFSVRRSWNMIGSIPTTVPTSSVIPVPPVSILSNYFWYNPDSGYVHANTIEAGKAYWVETDSSGIIVLNTSGAIAKSVSRNDDIDLKMLNSLRIQDGELHTQMLYFGIVGNNVSSLGKYELPPPAPSGMLDARFSSNKMIAVSTVGEKSAVDPIRISSGSFPVTVSWNVTNESYGKYSFEIVDESGNRSVTAMSGQGKAIVMSANSLVQIHVEGNGLPVSFSLKQNYPNPFNPTTMIRYEMPVDAHVQLSIYDVLGREVSTLVNEEQQAGVYDLRVDASGYASGVYFYRINAEPVNASSGFSRFQSVNKMIVLK